jgi:hypothetical protein
LIAALRDVRRVIEQATPASAAGALGSISMIVNRALSPENVTLFEGVPAGSEPTPVRPTDPATSRDGGCGHRAEADQPARQVPVGFARHRRL